MHFIHLFLLVVFGSYWDFFILEQNSISGACLLRKCCKGRAREGGDGGIIKETRDQYQVLWGSEGSERQMSRARRVELG